MRILSALFVVVTLAGGYMLVAEDKKAPPKITFKAKTGNVIYDHAAHAKREKNDCKVCHDKLFKQDATAPLNFRPAMHKTAETAKTSCGFCHRPAGPSFESKGNCTNGKCHIKGGTPSD